MVKTKETCWALGAKGLSRKAVVWCKNFFGQFDCSKLSRVTIRDGTQGLPGSVYGMCYYPDKKIKAFRITCNVHGPFPGRIETRKPPIYLEPGETLDDSELPNGYWISGSGRARRANGEVVRWARIGGITELLTVDEGVIWILMHEAFHFLRKTRQIPGRNIEHYADAYGDEGLEKWREYAARKT